MRKWYPWLLVGLAFGFSAVMYPRLPDRLPTHWNAANEIDGYSSKRWALSIFPLILVAMALILPRLPLIDPRRENYAKFRSSYDLVINCVMTLTAAIHVMMIGEGAGWPISGERALPFLMGGLFIVIGNVMPRARPNWLFGIRTPWTLTNDRVWERTHRLGGLLFVIMGILLALSGFFVKGVASAVLMAGISAGALVPVVYSYFAWKQESSRAPNS